MLFVRFMMFVCVVLTVFSGWLYVRKDLIDKFEPRVTGWLAHQAPFAFTMPAQTYADTIWRYVGGTPAVAALYQARAGHEIIGEIGVTRIRAKSLERIRQTAALGGLAIYEAALLVEVGKMEELAGLIVVEAPRELRISRLMTRDQITRKMAEQILAAQASDDQRRKAATHLIENSGTPEELRVKVKKLVETLQT